MAKSQQNEKKLKPLLYDLPAGYPVDAAWRKHIQVDDFDLGSGPRAFVEGGKLHPQYRIYVPKEFVLSDTEIEADGP